MSSRFAPLLMFLGASTLLSGTAAAQNTWWFDVTYSPGAPWGINSPDDYATLTLYAKWDPSAYAFNNAAMSVVADESLGTWIDPTELLHGPLSDNGVINGARIDGILTSQRQAPLEGVFADTSNPIKVWSVRWQTNDMTPRTVNISTETSAFFLYESFDGDWADDLEGFEEGGAGINIAFSEPAPASSIPFMAAASFALTARRR